MRAMSDVTLTGEERDEIVTVLRDYISSRPLKYHTSDVDELITALTREQAGGEAEVARLEGLLIERSPNCAVCGKKTGAVRYTDGITATCAACHDKPTPPVPLPRGLLSAIVEAEAEVRRQHGRDCVGECCRSLRCALALLDKSAPLKPPAPQPCAHRELLREAMEAVEALRVLLSDKPTGVEKRLSRAIAQAEADADETIAALSHPCAPAPVPAPCGCAELLRRSSQLVSNVCHLLNGLDDPDPKRITPKWHPPHWCSVNEKCGGCPGCVGAALEHEALTLGRDIDDILPGLLERIDTALAAGCDVRGGR